MRSIAVLPLLASTAAAYQNVQGLLARRTQVFEVLQARETDAISCLSGVTGAIADYPMPPSDLMNYMSGWSATATAKGADMYCAFATDLPASLSDSYSSYESKVSVWAKTAEPALSSAIEQCPAEIRSSMTTIEMPSECTGAGAAGSPGAAEATATGGSGGSSGTSSGGSSGAKKGGAPGAVSGYVAVAAGLAAGFVGVVAVL
ncbi:infection structure specific protein [Colletotrichum plurivorum]|uniref:Infection structure specific protein n=1 Tax=Colletotrichum plurivorum TaxID=2175906 RepID=A0A8H6JSX9_9PEZI|nr:infection structure specific protein [Colletotrichum plurivorum]